MFGHATAQATFAPKPWSGDPCRPGATELAEKLSAGPFSDALRAAIQAKGLSLDRIRHRLRVRGAPISITALSYWQSGRRRPERPDSMTALCHLEEVLDLPDGALSRLLGPPKPRGKGRQKVAPTIQGIGRDNQRLAELLAGVDTSSDNGLSRISQHDRVEIAADGGTHRVRSRQVLRADRDGVDRWVLVYDTDAPGNPLPGVGALGSCKLGRVVTDPAGGLMVAELLFDRPLRRDESLVLEYELVHHDLPYPASENTHFRRFRLPVCEYVLEVRFDARCRPARCEQFSAALDGDEHTTSAQPVVVDTWGYAHAVALNFGPGIFGIRWEWS
jgi:transcriptional regulator with XRE-family HTH domain